MAYLRRKFILTAFFILGVVGTKAQDKPIGYWESLLPYNTAIGVATDGHLIYTITNQAFFSFAHISGNMETYSKVNGMSDAGMAAIAYDNSTSTVVLGYANGNIDLFKNNTFYNIPDFKLEVIGGTKTINAILTENGIAYISTTMGVIVVDLQKQSITNNYSIINNNQFLPVSGFAITDSFYYAATSIGVYRAYKNDPFIQNSAEWKNINKKDSIYSIVALNNKLYFASHKKVFIQLDDTFQYVYKSAYRIQHIDASYRFLVIGEGSATTGKIKRMDFNNNVADSFDCTTPSLQAIELADSSLWMACPSGGLEARTGITQTQFFIPDGPSNPYSFGLYANNRDLWIAHGGYSENYFAYGSLNGLSEFTNDKWKLYDAKHFYPTGFLRDISMVIKDENTGNLYAGSYLNGLLTLHDNGDFSIVDDNALFDGSIAYGSDAHQVVGLAVDKSDNLWVSLMFAQHQLYVKTPDSTWYKFQLPNIDQGGFLTTDSYGQIWMACLGSDGVFVYNTANTLSNVADDTWYHLTAGVGNGNLPSNNATAIATDLNDKIWIGTDNGVCVVSRCSSPFTGATPCDATFPVVQNGSNPGNLFAGHVINCIVVDGANRKWLGTPEGAYLVSPDGSEFLYSFTSDNSPLPSNDIMSIAVDKVTGDVYFGTDMGVVSFRSTATEGGPSNQVIRTFPNPVPDGYNGAIAIKGLVENADVRITDINGQLVFHTTALGGQAVWNGKDYNGHRPQSGVYLIFTSDSKGKNTYEGKIVFMQ